MGRRMAQSQRMLWGAAVREGRAGHSTGGAGSLGGGPAHEVLVRLTLAEPFPVHLSTRASGRSKDFNSSRLILLSCNNIDMLLFSIFIHPPAKKEQLPSGHS